MSALTAKRCDKSPIVPIAGLAVFVRFWLVSTPPLPETALPTAQAKGRERYQRFVEALGRRLACGRTLAEEVVSGRARWPRMANRPR